MKMFEWFVNMQMFSLETLKVGSRDLSVDFGRPVYRWLCLSSASERVEPVIESESITWSISGHVLVPQKFVRCSDKASAMSVVEPFPFNVFTESTHQKTWSTVSCACHPSGIALTVISGSKSISPRSKLKMTVLSASDRVTWSLETLVSIRSTVWVNINLFQTKVTIK